MKLYKTEMFHAVDVFNRRAKKQLELSTLKSYIVAQKWNLGTKLVSTGYVVLVAACRGVPGHLVNQPGKKVIADNYNYALAA